MSLLFNDFASWQEHCSRTGEPLWQPVLAYEMEQKGRAEADIWDGLQRAYDVMCDAVRTGLSEDMTSRSGMIKNGAKKVAASPVTVLSPEFKMLVTRALGAKEVNSCMGRVVAAPTAGASGILPGILTTVQELHRLDDRRILEGLLVAAGIALIIEQNASLAGAVGGCQAETGSAAAMGAGAVVYCLGGSVEQAFAAVAITIQCMLGLVCDPVAGLVEVPCVVRNASASAIAFSSAQIAIAGVDPVIPVDQCVAALGEVGESMETRYKETALGGLANTPRARQIEQKVLVQDIQILPDQGE
ncbi:L-serine ammonia-lyase, iron-sulfur-dependent, subunit alpha [Hymenobacter sp. CRA2]|uniref:L-serine ammonia-lyase, iron-sulfur-dependent, subunit alpha n=1 Tax=Hymenobacter sp. CRA2 TaxID=1955620 RepID=UPI00098FEEC6|nr:L-serine ammonia-lyase, iron-sulfur-dependent, subunit alpha [Hymenobacter sp. CRA2]OON70666.1 L-serine ammonia-lyase, iron-sulfur-dependent, subunit alpha [Hymenobacter sp. CRA2]